MRKTLLSLTLFAGLALPGLAGAEPAAPAAPATTRVHLVGVMLGSGQALLWNSESAEYVLKKAGDDLGGAKIVELRGTELILLRGEQFEVLDVQPPPQAIVSGKKPRRASPATLVTAAAEAAPVAAAPAPAPVGAGAPAPAAVPAAVPVPVPVPAPVAAAAAVPVPVPVPAPVPVAAAVPVPAPVPAPAPVAAPVVAAAPAPAPAVEAAPAPALAAQAPLSPYPAAPEPAAAPAALPSLPAAPATPAPAAHAPATPADEDSALLIPRAEINEQLGNFEHLGQQATLAPNAGGGYRLTSLRPGSYLESLGLRAGDIVTRIDGRAINNPDDAARAYAWLRVTDHFTIDLLRDGRPVQLKFQVGA
jgi:PDZ domain